MEILCAILTGVFLWLFMHHLISFRHEWAVDLAGPLVYKISLPFKATIIYRTWPIIYNLMASAFFGLLIFKVHQWSQQANRFWTWNIFIFQIFKYVVIIILLFFEMINILVKKYSFDIRENGIVLGPFFFAWDRIKYCRWNKSQKKILIRFPYTSSKLKAIPEEFNSITQSLGRFVEVRDNENNIIAGSSNSVLECKSFGYSLLSWIGRAFHFQFDLTSLLLFVLLCASISSWYGIHYRRSIPQAAAIKRLNQFQPQVIEFSGDV